MNDTFAFELFGSRPSIAITTAQEQGVTIPVGSRMTAMALTQPSAPSDTTEAEVKTYDQLVDEITLLKQKEREAYGQKLGIIVAVIGIGLIYLLIQK